MDAPGYEQFDRVVATFRPRQTDDLRPEMARHIGGRFLFECCWIADDDERFAGQPVWLCDALGYWVPHEDLSDIDDAPDWAIYVSPATAIASGVRRPNEMRALTEG